MKYLLGEALTLRSLAYLELVRRWGDVPFKDGIANSDLSNVYMGKINRDSIYPFLIRDMQEAVECLPWVGEVGDYNCERVTKGFAKGLLARTRYSGLMYSTRLYPLYPHSAAPPFIAASGSTYCFASPSG